MLSTPFTQLLGCTRPIQSAPMSGGIATPAMVAAVARAGGIGMLPVQGLPPSVMEEMVTAVPEDARPGVGVTFLMPYFDDAAFEAACTLAQAGSVRLIDFYYRDPDAALVEAVHAAGVLASWQVGSVEEAIAAEQAGCDLITVQGQEAGGRQRSTGPLSVLLPAVRARVRVPVVAAGGLSNPRAVAAAFALGADAVRVGTRLIASEESGAHPGYQEAVIEACIGATETTDRFSGEWPYGPEPHRVLRSAIEAASAWPEDQPVARMAMGPEEFDVPRFHAAPPNLSTTGNVQAMALYAGVGVADVTKQEPVASIIEELMDGAERVIGELAAHLETG